MSLSTLQTVPPIAKASVAAVSERPAAGGLNALNLAPAATRALLPARDIRRARRALRAI
ncbi:MAG: hypothetical protein ACFB2Z_10850 [Maricaulaceae bacterium]